MPERFVGLASLHPIPQIQNRWPVVGQASTVLVIFKARGAQPSLASKNTTERPHFWATHRVFQPHRPKSLLASTDYIRYTPHVMDKSNQSYRDRIITFGLYLGYGEDGKALKAKLIADAKASGYRSPSEYIRHKLELLSSKIA